ncbi:MAG: methylaspartate mutase accessory protein GlmL [Porphyromonas sp.]|nr:methylaspartate mutase accessory protein GlmL [Porphyromonas sp.]
MKYLTVDFGSTYTKLTAIDSDKRAVIGTATSFTTIETHVMDGFNKALAKLEQQLGFPFVYDKLLCCSSAAGGLKMVALGLVPELTSKAARMAASSAGAKVVKTYAFEISKDEQEEIYRINPDLVLLCGGTDGGNKEVILANARRLTAIKRDFSIIAAGNKAASYELEEIFRESGKNCVITENVMPSFNQLNIEPAKRCIKDLFISRIIDAKGLSEAQAMTEYKIIPTPLAVLNGCELYSKGTRKSSGMGEIVAVDMGGATTDIYSMSDGAPTIEPVMIKGLKEPYSKRTVEGDLGMRYSLSALGDEVDVYSIAQELGIDEAQIRGWVDRCSSHPDTLAEENSIEHRIEEALARAGISLAVERHSGEIESVYTPMGQVFTLTGKDLSNVPYVIGIGGVLINSPRPAYILSGAKFDANRMKHTKPKNPSYLLDRRYIFASMGLLSSLDPELALEIMKKEIVPINL